MHRNKSRITRRAFFKKSSAATAAVAMGSLVTNDDLEAISANVNTNSQPSELRITDLRLARMRFNNRFLLRIDTNQGISGYGELRSSSQKSYALMLKSRIIGMNPCNVDKIFRKIKQFGDHGKMGVGPSGIEMACWDLAGKAWGVPVWQMLGGKFRDKIRIYADTPWDNDPVHMGEHLKERMDRGFTYLKMDMGIELIKNQKDTVSAPSGTIKSGWLGMVPGPFTGMRITEKGLKILQEYCATIREIVGWEIPIALDHFGHWMLDDCIKIARALDPFNFAWLEDLMPWMYTDAYVQLSNACTTPILTGEDIYLAEGFRDLFEKKAIAICHPDLGSAGGILEGKKIGDLAMKHGIAMALHMEANPVSMFAAVHAAAATENFLCLEHHDADMQWWDDLVDGVPKPIVQDGFITVPDSPGLGVELNEKAVKDQMRDPKQYFLPTPEWDNERAWDRIWSDAGNVHTPQLNS